MSRRKQKAHLRDWILFSRKVIKTRCGIYDDFIEERDANASPDTEAKGMQKIPREELCKNCMATLHN